MGRRSVNEDMSFVIYASEKIDQIILFRLCVKCGKLVRLNEICECESLRDMQGKNDGVERFFIKVPARA